VWRRGAGTSGAGRKGKAVAMRPSTAKVIAMKGVEELCQARERSRCVRGDTAGNRSKCPNGHVQRYAPTHCSSRSTSWSGRRRTKSRPGGDVNPPPELRQAVACAAIRVARPNISPVSAARRGSCPPARARRPRTPDAPRRARLPARGPRRRATGKSRRDPSTRTDRGQECP
jgi:hypothetical protein